MMIEILEHDIDYWYGNDQEMPEHEQRHVRNSILEGYSQGELVDDDTTGWWKIARDWTAELLAMLERYVASDPEPDDQLTKDARALIAKVRA